MDETKLRYCNMEKFPKLIKKEAKGIRPRPEDVEIWRPTKPMTGEEIRKAMKKEGVRPLTLEEMGTPKELVEKLKKEGTVIIGEEKKETQKAIPKKELKQLSAPEKNN